MPDPTQLERIEAPAPVRIVHLGLGAFARAHLLWYTQRANETATAEQWGVAGFTGRSAAAAETLAAPGRPLHAAGPLAPRRRTHHDRRARGRPRRCRRRRVARVLPPARGRRRHPDRHGGRLPANVGGCAGPSRPRGRLRHRAAAHRRDAVTAPGRLVDGLRARRAVGTGPIAVVSCDNLPENGLVARRVTLDLASAVDPALAAWIEQHVSFVSTMVDRITPATTDADRAVVRSLTGREDRSPVVTEPFSEWVLQGDFPADRPRWEAAGARFVDDLEPYERRKLWLLNAGHSLLAYAGLARGLTTVADAFADPACRAELEQLWSEAAEVLSLPADDATRRAARALRERPHRAPARADRQGRVRQAAGPDPRGRPGPGSRWASRRPRRRRRRRGLDRPPRRDRHRPRCRRPGRTPGGSRHLRPRLRSRSTPSPPASPARTSPGTCPAARRPPTHLTHHRRSPTMKIVSADVIVTSPNRNFVTLKLTTDEGLTGLGDATLNGRELAVVSYLRDHVVPLLVGRDADRIEERGAGRSLAGRRPPPAPDRPGRSLRP